MQETFLGRIIASGRRWNHWSIKWMILIVAAAQHYCGKLLVFSKHDFTPTALHGWSFFRHSGSPIRFVCGAFWGQDLGFPISGFNVVPVLCKHSISWHQWLYVTWTWWCSAGCRLSRLIKRWHQSWTGPLSLSSSLLVLLWGILLSVCQRVFPANSVLFHHTNTLRCRVTDLRPVCATALLYGVGTWDGDP